MRMLSGSPSSHISSGSSTASSSRLPPQAPSRHSWMAALDACGRGTRRLSFRAVLPISVRLGPFVGGVGEYLADATALEAAGAHTLWLAEESSVGGGTETSPWPVLGALAAVTSRVRLGCVVREPGAWRSDLLGPILQSLDRLSRGRLVIAVGAAGREHLIDDAVGPLHGPDDRPVLVEADAEPGYALAARTGSGLVYTGETADGAATAVGRVRDASGPGFEVWAAVGLPASRTAWRETLDAYDAAGVTGVIVAHDPRLLDLLRNADLEDDRSDLALATG